jgi:hypothetical protein
MRLAKGGKEKRRETKERRDKRKRNEGKEKQATHSLQTRNSSRELVPPPQSPS